MPDASNAILKYEADQTAVAITELTNQGDNLDFRSANTLWSAKEGRVPVVTPNGIYDGGIMSAAVSGSDDVIDVTQCRAYLAGVLTTISASTDEAITRQSTSDYCIHSLQVTSGGAFSVVKGTEGSAFSETRGAAGGPPAVLVDSVELGQVRLSSQVAAPITADEIYQTQSHQERWDYPAWDVNYINVANGALGYAGITFISALPTIHTSSAVKDVYASWYTPIFSEIVDAYDWVPPANTITINSTEVYGRVKGGKTQSLGPGSFSAHLQDGVSDNILRHQNANIWFQFFPNRLNAPYQLAQGYMALTQSFPAGGNIEASFTVAAESQGSNIFA
jgi:hypothetical protein